uniref:SWIM-type domain-containing protein n=1 Tax=Lactuca sativa TaxID=4236 RepID=A0A9R1W795_LACSA|nr:hypothetical protein LSAT_V11C300139310 [Lactuca sativa]
MFDTFKKEWTEAITNLTHEIIIKTTEESTYGVGQLDVDKKYWCIVTFCSLNQVIVTCSCSMYETNGILCKHSLYVMKKKHVQEHLSHYILLLLYDQANRKKSMSFENASQSSCMGVS